MSMREFIFACGSFLCVEVAECVMCATTVAMLSFRSIVVVLCSTFHRVILFSGLYDLAKIAIRPFFNVFGVFRDRGMPTRLRFGENMFSAHGYIRCSQKKG